MSEKQIDNLAQKMVQANVQQSEHSQFNFDS